MKAAIAVLAAVAVAGAVLVAISLRPTAVPAPAVSIGGVSPEPAPSAAASATPTPPEAVVSDASPTTTSPAPRTPKPSAAAPPAEPESGAAATGESPPTRMRIDALRLDSTAIVELGLDAKTGQVESPARADDIGWFIGAHTPGGPGVAVVAAHVTWNGAKGPFFGLGQLGQGDKIAVDREDGSTATFAVRRIQTYAKDEFPTDEVYRPTDGKAELVLVTCGGKFDADRRYYSDNVVVWADPV